MRRVQHRKMAACSVCSSLFSGKSLVVRRGPHLEPLLLATRHEAALSNQQRCDLRLRLVLRANEISTVQCSWQHKPEPCCTDSASPVKPAAGDAPLCCLQGRGQRRRCVPHSCSCPGTSVGCLP